MHDALAALTAQILALSIDERAEVLRAVLGTGLLPEAPDPEAADLPPKYKVQGIEVDEETFRFVDQTLGIFSVEQLGMSPQRVVEAFEMEGTNRRIQANLNATLRREDTGYGAAFRVRAELKEIADFVGLKTPNLWDTPSAADIRHAILQLIKPVPENTGEPANLYIVPEPPDLAPEIIALLDEYLPIVSAHIANGENVDIVAVELFGGMLPLTAPEGFDIEQVVAYAARSLPATFQSETSKQFLRDVLSFDAPPPFA